MLSLVTLTSAGAGIAVKRWMDYVTNEGISLTHGLGAVIDDVNNIALLMYQMTYLKESDALECAVGR